MFRGTSGERNILSKRQSLDVNRCSAATDCAGLGWLQNTRHIGTVRTEDTPVTTTRASRIVNRAYQLACRSRLQPDHVATRSAESHPGHAVADELRAGGNVTEYLRFQGGLDKPV